MGTKVHRYESEHLTVHFDGRRCIHAAECVHGLPAVFDPQQRPWVRPEGAEADAVAEVVTRCPTGALSYTRHDGAAAEATPTTNRVTIAADGPLFCRGDLEVKRSDGEVVVRDTRIGLCRCGLSRNKPFCDGAHDKGRFADGGSIDLERARPKDPEEGTCALQVTLAANGPLIFSGPMEIHSADGSVTFHTGRAALCRCGASENKPFCDGAHKQIDFTAE